MSPKRSGEIEAARAMTPAFASARPEPQDSQIANFGFASHTSRVDADRQFELMLEAEPRHSATRGLGWRMTLSGHLCLENSCEQLFESELAWDLSQRLARSKKPLADACEARPELLARALARFPGLAERLGAAALAVEEGKTLGSSVAKGSPVRRKPAL